jgi:hypothetical protein
MIEITGEEIEDWLQSKGTRWFMEQVQKERDFVAEQLATGQTLAPGEVAAATGRAVGTIDGLDFILQKEFISD